MTKFDDWLESLSPLQEKGAQLWIESRPPEIQELIRRHPPCAALRIKNKNWYIMGYYESEDGRLPGLIVTPVDPSEDYDKAIKAKEYICPDHL